MVLWHRAGPLSTGFLMSTGTRCRHCEDYISGKSKCGICEKLLEDQCLTCHREVEHGKIEIQNIHICGNPSGGNSIDADPDAYGRAD